MTYGLGLIKSKWGVATIRAREAGAYEYVAGLEKTHESIKARVPGG